MKRVSRLIIAFWGCNKIRFLKVHGNTNALLFTLNGNLEAGLVLIDEIWSQLEDQSNTLAF